MIIAYNTLDGLVLQEMATNPEFEHIAVTPEIQTQINSMVKPKLIDRIIVESATIEEIEALNKPKVPFEVPLWKLRFILEQMGLEIAVSDAINQLPEPTRSAGKKLWNIGTAVERNSPTVSLIKKTLNIDDAQADQIFINADSVTL